MNAQNLLPFDGVMPEVDEDSFVAPTACLIGKVKVGKGASVWHHAVLRGDLNRIEIGDRSNIQDGCIVHVTDQLPVVVEEDVTVGHGAILHGCTIKRGCLIAMRATVLDGAVVGEGSVIAAGAIVPEGAQIPPGSVVMGIPGKVVREVREKDREKLAFLSSSYVELSSRYKGLR
ncbi:MAG: gamma carbonic anhydrase family protein [Thermanaerothrix sp.]|nr:gamma carbonic anhydrase family protein [Thermanaerothrix sp.]